MPEAGKPVDIYARIYGNCQDTLLFQTMLRTVEQALGYAEKKGVDEAENPFVCANEWWNGGLSKIKKDGIHFELLTDVLRLADVLRDDYAAQFGPRLSVEGPAHVSMQQPHILAFGFDDDIDAELCRFSLAPDFEWNDSAFARAATAYRRTCGWDFAPGEAGVWLCYYVITDGSGSDKSWWHNGNLVGFAILYDREKNGRYTNLAHIWTAAAARRRGVASALIAHAREHFPLKHVEGPVTNDGAALFGRVWPEILEATT